ncbi:hypothetical protein HYR54_00530 [Candidatus Acetothermia bacterium]|nr:hypothetical protein [Candidatus Acetothermia bacterium]
MNFNISNLSLWVSKLEFYEMIGAGFLALYGLRHLSSKKDRLVGIGALGIGIYFVLRSGNTLGLWNIQLPVLPFGQTSTGGGGSAANRPI